jgi:hypothetical protein
MEVNTAYGTLQVQHWQARCTELVLFVLQHKVSTKQLSVADFFL